MSSFNAYLKACLIAVPMLIFGCALLSDEPSKKSPPFGFITTPPTYYSTAKARYLGEKYKANLDRLVERIVRNPKTANLQFANNIASVGGIGFFTHSAVKTPDERYLEVILGAPETFERKGDYSSKVNRLFSLYGTELLAILSGDSDIYQEKEVSGYGLHLSWRNVASGPAGSRVALERAIAYFPKEKVRGFVRREVSENDLLAEAVIFAVEEDGPINLVSYRPQELQSDFRPPIQEETLAGAKVEKPEVQPPVAAPARLPVDDTPQVEKKIEQGESQRLASQDKSLPSAVQPQRPEKKEEAKPTPAPRKVIPATATPPAALAEEAKPEDSARQKASEPATVDKGKAPLKQAPQLAEPKPQTRPAAPAMPAKAAETVAPSARITEASKTQKSTQPPEPSQEPGKERPAEVVAKPEEADETKPQEQVAVIAKAPTLPVAPRVAAEKKAEVVPVVPKAGVRAPEAAPTPPAPVAPVKPEKSNEKSGNEQIALLRNKANETRPENRPMAKPAPRALEGYIIQLAFTDKSEARRWAETLERRGYAVSVTEAGGEAVRVRIGNFAVRDEAERQLRSLRQDGLTGIVVNLPQAYRPEIGTPPAEGSGKEVTATQ